MDVKEFVSKTLQQLKEAVLDANSSTGPEEFKSFGSTHRVALKAPNEQIYQDYNGTIYTNIEFDLAVTVSAEGGANAKLKIPYFEAGGGGKKTSETVSRVKFSVPFRLG